MEQWAVGGREKRELREIPSGVYTGMVRVRDSEGQVIVSKSFSQELPPADPDRED
jgi:hypothetical protein